MVNALLILFLVVCIYALIGVEFFSSVGEGGYLVVGGMGNVSISNTNQMGLDALPYWSGEECSGDL